MANGGINPIQGLIAGVGLAVEPEETYRQTRERYEAFEVLNEAVKEKKRLQSEAISEATQKRLAWNHTNQSLGVLLAAISREAISYLHDSDLKTPEDIDKAMVSYFKNVDDMMADDRFKKKDFQTMIHSATSVVRQTIKDHKADVGIMHKLSDTYEQIQSIQVGGKKYDAEGNVVTGGAGNYTSLSTNENVGKILENIIHLKSYRGWTNKESAMTLITNMETLYKKKLYVQQMMKGYDFLPGQDHPGVQLDPDYKDKFTNMPLGNQEKTMVLEVEKDLSAGLIEQAFNRLTGAEADKAADRTSLGNALAAFEKEGKDYRRSETQVIIAQLNKTLEIGGLATLTALAGSGVTRTLGVSTASGTFNQGVYFDALAYDVSGIDQMMRGKGSGGLGSEGWLDGSTVAEFAEVLTARGRRMYAGGMIRMIKKGHFVYNDYGATSYTDKSGNPLKNMEWGDNIYMMGNLNPNLVADSRKKLADMVNTSKIIKDNRTVNVTPEEKLTLINYYGIIIEEFLNHDLNGDVQERKRAALIAGKELAETEKVTDLKYQAHIIYAADAIADILDGKSDQPNKLKQLEEWKAKNIKTKENPSGNWTESEVKKIIMKWVEEYGKASEFEKDE